MYVPRMPEVHKQNYPNQTCPKPQIQACVAYPSSPIPTAWYLIVTGQAWHKSHVNPQKEEYKDQQGQTHPKYSSNNNIVYDYITRS